MQTLLDSNDLRYYERYVPTIVPSNTEPYYHQEILDEPVDDSVFASAFAQYLFHQDIIVDANQTTSVYQYLDDMSYEHAVELLHSFGFHIPLTQLMDYLRPHLDAVQEISAHGTPSGLRRGGMQEANEGFEMVRNPRSKVWRKKLESVIALDTLKDIFPTSTDTLWQMTRLSDESIKTMKKLTVCKTQEDAYRNETKYRHHIDKHVAQLLNVVSFRNTIPMESESALTKLEADTILYQQILRWMTDDTVYIVFDGLLNDVNVSSFLRRTFLMAVVQVMLTNVIELQQYSKHLNTSAYMLMQPLPKSIRKIHSEK